MTDTTTRNDEQYDLAKAMTADYGRVLDLCARIQERNEVSGEPWDDDMIRRIVDEHIGDPLEITATCTMSLSVLHGYESARMTDYVDYIDVLLGTGGPARGIRFYDADRAECWHQNWWVPKAFAPLDSAAAEFLANHWGLFE